MPTRIGKNLNRAQTPSDLLAELHVYILPWNKWIPFRRLARNKVVEETISAGFIHVQPNMVLHELRDFLRTELPTEIPDHFVFVKSVGRNFTQVRRAQELVVKVKSFLPPRAKEPEIHVLELSEEIVRSYGSVPNVLLSESELSDSQSLSSTTISRLSRYQIITNGVLEDIPDASPLRKTHSASSVVTLDEIPSDDVNRNGSSHLRYIEENNVKHENRRKSTGGTTAKRGSLTRRSSLSSDNSDTPPPIKMGSRQMSRSRDNSIDMETGVHKSKQIVMRKKVQRHHSIDEHSRNRKSNVPNEVPTSHKDSGIYISDEQTNEESTFVYSGEIEDEEDYNDGMELGEEFQKRYWKKSASHNKPVIEKSVLHRTKPHESPLEEQDEDEGLKNRKGVTKNMSSKNDPNQRARNINQNPNSKFVQNKLKKSKSENSVHSDTDQNISRDISYPKDSSNISNQPGRKKAVSVSKIQNEEIYNLNTNKISQKRSLPNLATNLDSKASEISSKNISQEVRVQNGPKLPNKTWKDYDNPKGANKNDPSKTNINKHKSGKDSNISMKSKKNGSNKEIKTSHELQRNHLTSDKKSEAPPTSCVNNATQHPPQNQKATSIDEQQNKSISGAGDVNKFTQRDKTNTNKCNTASKEITGENTKSKTLIHSKQSSNHKTTNSDSRIKNVRPDKFQTSKEIPTSENRSKNTEANVNHIDEDKTEMISSTLSIKKSTEKNYQKKNRTSKVENHKISENRSSNLVKDSKNGKHESRETIDRKLTHTILPNNTIHPDASDNIGHIYGESDIEGYVEHSNKGQSGGILGSNSQNAPAKNKTDIQHSKSTKSKVNKSPDQQFTKDAENNQESSVVGSKKITIDTRIKDAQLPKENQNNETETQKVSSATVDDNVIPISKDNKEKLTTDNANKKSLSGNILPVASDSELSHKNKAISRTSVSKNIKPQTKNEKKNSNLESKSQKDTSRNQEPSTKKFSNEDSSTSRKSNNGLNNAKSSLNNKTSNCITQEISNKPVNDSTSSTSRKISDHGTAESKSTNAMSMNEEKISSTEISNRSPANKLTSVSEKLDDKCTSELKNENSFPENQSCEETSTKVESDKEFSNAGRKVTQNKPDNQNTNSASRNETSKVSTQAVNINATLSSNSGIQQKNRGSRDHSKNSKTNEKDMEKKHHLQATTISQNSDISSIKTHSSDTVDKSQNLAEIQAKTNDANQNVTNNDDTYNKTKPNINKTSPENHPGSMESGSIQHIDKEIRSQEKHNTGRKNESENELPKDISEEHYSIVQTKSSSLVNIFTNDTSPGSSKVTDHDATSRLVSQVLKVHDSDTSEENEELSDPGSNFEDDRSSIKAESFPVSANSLSGKYNNQSVQTTYGKHLHIPKENKSTPHNQISRHGNEIKHSRSRSNSKTKYGSRLTKFSSQNTWFKENNNDTRKLRRNSSVVEDIERSRVGRGVGRALSVKSNISRRSASEDRGSYAPHKWAIERESKKLEKQTEKKVQKFAKEQAIRREARKQEEFQKFAKQIQQDEFAQLDESSVVIADNNDQEDTRHPDSFRLSIKPTKKSIRKGTVEPTEPDSYGNSSAEAFIEKQGDGFQVTYDLEFERDFEGIPKDSLKISSSDFTMEDELSDEEFHNLGHDHYKDSVYDRLSRKGPVIDRPASRNFKKTSTTSLPGRQELYRQKKSVPANYKLHRNVMENAKEYEAKLKDVLEEKARMEDRRTVLFAKARSLHEEILTLREKRRSYWWNKYNGSKKLGTILEDQQSHLRHEMDNIYKTVLGRIVKKSPLVTGIRDEPSRKASYKISAIKLRHEISDLRRRVEAIDIQLKAETRLRQQAEREVKQMRSEINRKKANVALTMSRAPYLQDTFLLENFLSRLQQ